MYLTENLSLFNNNPRYILFPYRINELIDKFQHLLNYRLVINLFKVLENYLCQYKQATICHGDLSNANILCTERGDFYIIDWEIACVWNGLFDVASIANFLRLDTKQEKFFLQQYYQCEQSTEIKGFYLLMKLFAYLYFALAFIIICEKQKNWFSANEIIALPKFSDHAIEVSNFWKSLQTDKDRYAVSIELLKSAHVLLECNNEQIIKAINNISGKKAVEDFMGIDFSSFFINGSDSSAAATSASTSSIANVI